jgi:hypothetical protein
MDIDNAKEAVTIGYAEGDSINRVTQNITVPMTGSNGTTISWESNDTEVINISGSSGMVTRPSYTAGDAYVTVTASVYKGGMTSCKEFVLTVVKLPMSDAEAVALDRDALAIGYAEGDSAASVTQNLTLPAGGSNGSTISWASDKGDVISSTGSVTRPANADGDSKVVLTVTINKSSDSTTKEFTLTVKKRDAASSGGRTSSSSTSQSASGTVSISVNGQAQQASGTLTATSEGGKTVATVTVDARKIEEKLNTEGKNSVVTIPVTTGADVVVGEFNGQTVKSMEEKETVIEIKTSTAAYALPASQINITGISAQIGQQVDLKDIKVSIEIAKASQETAKVVENSAKAGEFTIVAPPVEFTVTCTSGDKTVNISSFSAYVERTIAIPSGVDPSKVTTGVVIDPDGTVRHVPTRIVQIDGVYYAKINSLTNSTYSVISHPYEFKDVANHWAKVEINDMGSRMVVSGVGDGMYEPDRDITRAEFAAIIVRALGLKPGIGSNPFSDVKTSEWYCDYIKTAYEYKIISGYRADTFGPMDKITREQAMTMISRAMNLTGLKTEFEEGEAEKLIAAFGDGMQTSDWAKRNVAACVKIGIVSGRDNNIIAPQENITRAEVAVTIRRLLQKSNLI